MSIAAIQPPAARIATARHSMRISASTDGWATARTMAGGIQLDALKLFNARTNQISHAYGSLIKTDSLYNMCFGTGPAQAAPPAAACQNGVMDYVVHPIEPLMVRLTLAGTF
jgi:hypothetical protein